MAEVAHPGAVQGAVLRAWAITGLALALGVAWSGWAAAQSGRAVGILTGKERAQYDASLAFCREQANRDKIRCKRFERAYPGTLPARQPPGEAPKIASPNE